MKELKYPHLVFVYGTLKKGEPNYGFYMEDEKKFGKQCFVAHGQTLRSYPLVVASQYNIPFLLDAPGKGHQIQGEVYNVDDKMLETLDTIEEIPTFYIRRTEDIVLSIQEEEEEVVQCGVYVLPDFDPSLLQRKMLSSYSTLDPTNPQFVPRHLRTDVLKTFQSQVKIKKKD